MASRKEVRKIMRTENVGQKEAWVIGFHAADGCITKSSRPDDPKTFSYTLNSKDRDALTKIKNIFDTDASIKDYRNNQDKDVSILRFVSRENEKIFDNLDVKRVIPSRFLNGDLNRHYLRGLFDGDGCIHHRSRKGLMMIFINKVEDIVERFAYSISKHVGLTFKVPRRIKEDNLYRIQWESREARLLAWYLYHGEIEELSMDRKRNEYLKCVRSDNDLDQLFECFFGKDLRYKPKLDDKGMYIPVSYGPTTNSLETTKSLSNLCRAYGIDIRPVFKNKGRYKYYIPYLTYKDAIKVNMLRPYCLDRVKV